MSNRVYFTIIFAFSYFVCFSQTATIDSLKDCFYKAESNTSRWLYAITLSAQTYRSNTDTGLVWGNKALFFARKIADDSLEASALSTIGVCHYYKGDYDNALDFYFKAVEIAEKKGYKRISSTALGNVGMLYAEKNDFDKAVGYLKMALKQKIELKDSMGIARNYANLGVTFSNRIMPDSALVYYLKQVELCDLLNEKFGKAIGLNNIGQVYLEKKQRKEALDYFQQSLDIKELLGDKQGMSLTLTNIAEVYLQEQRRADALPILENALQLAKEANSFPNMIKPYKFLSETYSALGNYKKAFEYQHQLIEVKDTLNRKESLDRAANLEAKYQNEQQKSELIKKELIIERQSYQRNLIIILATLAIFTLFIAFYYIRTRQRQALLIAKLEHAEVEKLREVNTLKSNFFANISHEFRTPLTLILSPLEQIINGSLKGDLRKYYNIMFRNGKRLLQLVNQLLDLSKLESGKMKLEAAEGDLALFARVLTNSFESLAIKKRIDYQILIPAEPIIGYFDSDKIEKIISNLVSNAFKFTMDGKKIVVSLSISGSQAIFKVEDEGIGIPADQIPHLFNRFSKPNISEIQQGSGIGLALTKELAELHGGKIEINSQPDLGSIFTVTFSIGKDFFSPEEIVLSKPMRTPNLVNNSESIPTDHLSNNAPFYNLLGLNSNPVVLIIEDNMELRKFIVDQLSEDFQIIEAENGKVGIEKSLESTPDLIISDIMMPEIDGLRLCEILKQNEKTSHVPIILLTALAEHEEKLKGLDSGADDYMAKPFDSKELKIKVSNLIAGRKKMHEFYRKSFNGFSPISDLQAQSAEATFLKKVREFIEENLEDENFSVIELSTQMGMSRSQLHRKLSALAGLTPNEAIRNIRLERAKLLLEKRVGNASEIAFMTGFSSPAYFSKCFKDYFGYTPSEVLPSYQN